MKSTTFNPATLSLTGVSKDDLNKIKETVESKLHDAYTIGKREGTRHAKRVAGPTTVTDEQIEAIKIEAYQAGFDAGVASVPVKTRKARADKGVARKVKTPEQLIQEAKREEMRKAGLIRPGRPRRERTPEELAEIARKDELRAQGLLKKGWPAGKPRGKRVSAEATVAA